MHKIYINNRPHYRYTYENTCDGVNFKFNISRVKVFMFTLRVGLILCSTAALGIESELLLRLASKIDNYLQGQYSSILRRRLRYVALVL